MTKITEDDEAQPKDNEREGQPHSSSVAGVQFLRKAVAVKTDIESPIQGPVLDEQPLLGFLKQNHDATIPKMWGVFLDDRHMVLGIEPLAFGDDAAADRFNRDTKTIFHYFAVFRATRYILIQHRVNALDDPTPTDADKELIDMLLMQSKIMGADLSNYVIFSTNHYWSTRQQNGTACHCGSQDYIPED